MAVLERYPITKDHLEVRTDLISYMLVVTLVHSQEYFCVI